MCTFLSAAGAQLVVEMNAGQMLQDVERIGRGRVPVHFLGRMGGMIPLPAEMLEALRELKRCMATTGFRGFDRTIQETNTWLHEIAERMDNPDRHMAYHALCGVLFALAAQLPMLIRGIYFEGYKVAGKPERYHAEEFLARVAQKLHKAGPANPAKATHAVFAVMDRHITVGEINDIYQALPKDLRRLWPALEPA